MPIFKQKHKLYTSVVPSSIPENQGTFGKKHMYGEQRRDMMACRYYYHSNLCRLRYDDCLVQLSREFFLSTNTIEANLAKRHAYLLQLVEARTTARALKAEYPWMLWDLPKGLPAL